MMMRAEMEMPTLTPTFALSDSVGVGGTAKRVEVTIKTVIGIIPELCLDVIKLVVELGNVGVPWTSVIAASVRRAVGMPDVGGNHGVRFGDKMLPSCR
jgi:hypothetical protein